MFFSSFGKLLLAAGLFQSAVAHNINLPAHGRECFHETLKRDDRMTVTFQVGDREFGSSGNIEIDFWVRALAVAARPRVSRVNIQPEMG